MKTPCLPLGVVLLCLGVAAPAFAQADAGTPPMNNGAPANRPLPQKILLPDSGPQDATIHTDRDRYAPGQPVHIAFVVSNPAKAKLDYDFPSAQQFDVSVTDARGTEVWRLSQGKMYAQMLSHLSLPPGAKKTYDAVWNGTDSRGRAVPPGTYTLTAALTNTPPMVVTGGVIVNNDPDPNNIGMPTKSPAETGAVRQVRTQPRPSATKTVTIGGAAK